MFTPLKVLETEQNGDENEKEESRSINKTVMNGKHVLKADNRSCFHSTNNN